MTATHRGFAAMIDDVDSLFADRAVNGVLLDRAGTIVYVNAGWKAFATEAGLALPNFGIGQNYLRYCAFADEQSARIIEGITQLLLGRLDCLSYVYPCHSATTKRWFVLLGFSHVRDELTALLHLNVCGLMPKGAEAGEPTIVTDHFGPRAVTLQPTIVTDHFGPRAVTLQCEQPLRGLGATSLPGGTAHDAIPAGIAAAAAFPHVSKHTPLAPLLSKRQQQVLELMAKGMSNVEIGRALAISPNTVKIHVSGILARLGLPSRAQAIHWTLTRHLSNHPRAPEA